MLSVESQRKVEQLILQGNLIPADQLERLKQEALEQNKSLISVLSESKLLNEEQLTQIQAQASGVPYVNLTGVRVKPDILALLSRDVADNYQSVPFGYMQTRLAVAMLDPSNVQAVDFISRRTGKPVMAFMASRDSIAAVLNQYQADLKDVSAALEEEAFAVEEEKPKKQTAKAVQTLVQDAPITRALNAIIDYAIQSRASDIHVEPREKELRIRFRVDGILQDTMKLPKATEPALISRIKILSNLKIDEHRVPQDGEFQVHTNGRNVDLRIAIAPITWGEQVVIRLLNKDDQLLTLDHLGFKGRAFRVIKEGIAKPHGMTLSTGPTGSGKSTTLYAVVQELKNVAVNIVTLEDPVEYKMDGVNQIQVNPEVGLTFASGLRSILRQDPNIILVGEIRDKETADLGVQAALTGHIVLSTLHTNSAAGVLPRLLDMDVEPFLIASTVNTVIGQRLVRQLCQKCKKPEKAKESEIQSINKTIGPLLSKIKGDTRAINEELGYENLPLGSQNAYTLYRAVGCSACMNGYQGRVAIAEVFAMNEAMEKLLVARATTVQIQEQTAKDGMLTMKQDGYFKALSGVTTLEEVARVAADF